MGWYLVLLLVLAVFVVPFFAGTWLAGKLRMPDHGWKVGLILFVALASVLVDYAGWPPKLGVDLSGGVILVYQVDQEALKQTGKKLDMDQLIAAIKERVNPGGQKEMVIRQYGVDQIEIIMPKATEEEVREIQRILRMVGSLEFRILANRQDNPEEVERALATPGKIVLAAHAKPNEPPVGWWVPVRAGREHEFSGYAVTRNVKRGSEQRVEVFVLNDVYDVTGKYLHNAYSTNDERGQRAVGFQFNPTGGNLFSQLTAANVQRHLGIILDRELYSAPNIRTQIGDHGIITGSFTEQEIKDQVRVLTSGSLPAALTPEPLSVMYSGPTLGADTIAKSSYAMIISAILVPLFMLWYYRFSGIVANIALVLNMTALVGIMIAIKAPFTLTGLAGLALTVGMAVDNNVLVYERLREEIERGAALRMAIRNAFQRATAVIVDANLTTIIAATVMYAIGTDQVKGFAVTLWLGVAISLFTSVFVARVIFEIAEKQRWISKLKMLRVIGETKIDFMSLFPAMATMSTIITIGALVVAGVRGKSLFDIDFTGGVSVQILFKDPQQIQYVREAVEGVRDTALPDVAVSDVTMLGEEPGRRFVINTSNPELKGVEATMAQIFSGKLETNSVSVAGMSPVVAAAVPAASPGSSLAPAGPLLTPPANPSAVELAPGAKPPAAKPAEEPKSTEKKSDAKKDEAKKPEEKTPDAKKPEEKKSDAKKPDEKKPDEKKPDEKKPDEKKQSRRDLPPDTMLALADGPALTPASPARAAKTAAEEKPAAAPPAETKPAEQKTPAPPAETPQTAPPAEKPAAADVESPFLGGTQAHFKFALPVAPQSVEEMLGDALKATGRSAEQIAMEVTNPEALPGESKALSAWDVKLKLPPDEAQQVFTTLEKQLQNEPAFPASNAIGGQVAGNTQLKAIYALVLSWFFMILYLWIRFQRVAFGLAAVVALVHDVLVMLGAIAISYYIAPYFGFLMIDPFKINLAIVAAFLTIIGYSVNDTIVVFDRIREIRGKDPHFTRQMVNNATNQTLSRTLLTSFTVLLVVVVLYLYGGEAVHGFAFALSIGVFTGTYSSIYVAAPILLWLIGTEKAKE